MSIIVLLTGAHILFAAVAIFLAARSGIYPRNKLALQAVLALMVPVVGAVWVILMRSESKAETAKPSTNEWIRIETGEG